MCNEECEVEVLRSEDCDQQAEGRKHYKRVS